METKKNHLYFLPLGGAGEIGMNLNLYGYGPSPDEASWLIVDIGVTFSAKERLFGLEMSMADPTFIEKRRKNLLGILLTHAHEDHIGAAHHLWDKLRCPIYTTPFTAYLLKDKFAEKGISIDALLHLISPQEPLALGPFTVEFVHVTHSTLESNAIILKTPLGSVLHTGDWKIDENPILGELCQLERLKTLGQEGILAVVGDSTNALTEGTSGSEGALAESLEQLVQSIPGGLAVTTFASNIARLYSLMQAGQKAGRKIAFAGRSMYRALNAARDTGYLKDIPEILSEESLAYLDKKDYMLICTGSQGEVRAALTRIAHGTHQRISLGKDDTVIFSSRIIPGNELDIFSLQNKLAERGIHILTEKDHFVHVSGHPCRNELTQLYNLVKPEVVIPVHGEMRHMLEHISLAQSLGVPYCPLVQNGDLVQLAPDGPHVIQKISASRLHLDGILLIRDNDEALRERRTLARQGLVIINIILNKRDDLVSDPHIHFVGVPLTDDQIKESIVNAIYDFMETLARQKKQSDEQTLRKQIGRCVQNTLIPILGKQPMVRTFVVRCP